LLNRPQHNHIPLANVPLIGTGPQKLEWSQACLPGPLAAPATFVNHAPDKLQFFSVGGLTKLEHMTAMIADGFCRSYGYNSINPDAIGACVDFAAAVLAECDRRQRAAEKQQAGE
jgi:hypothetical protein